MNTPLFSYESSEMIPKHVASLFANDATTKNLLYDKACVTTIQFIKLINHLGTINDYCTDMIFHDFDKSVMKDLCNYYHKWVGIIAIQHPDSISQKTMIHLVFGQDIDDAINAFNTNKVLVQAGGGCTLCGYVIGRFAPI